MSESVITDEDRQKMALLARRGGDRSNPTALPADKDMPECLECGGTDAVRRITDPMMDHRYRCARCGVYYGDNPVANTQDRKRPTATDAELIADVKRLARELGHSPTLNEYDEHGNYHRQVAADRFGTWNNLKERAGLVIYPPGDSNFKFYVEGNEWH